MSDIVAYPTGPPRRHGQQPAPPPPPTRRTAAIANAPQQRRFVWRLEELVLAQGIRHVTTLQRELADRGIELSSSQTHRLVTQPPDRLDLDVLAALSEILGCSPAD